MFVFLFHLLFVNYNFISQGFFPGLIHVAYVLRPAGFLQKAISEVSNKLFKDEFKFKVCDSCYQCVLIETKCYNEIFV